MPNLSANALAVLPAPTTYTRLLLQRWSDRAEELLAGTGLVAADLLRAPSITATQQLAVFRNAMTLSGRADWSLEFGHQLGINSHGPLGFAAVSAPTLGEGLDVLAKFARIRAPYLEFESRLIDDRYLLQISASAIPLGELELALGEIVLQIAESYVEAVLGHSAAGSIAFFRAPPPPHAARYADFLAARCEFNAPATALSLPAGLLPLPCPLYDEKTYRAALARCRDAYDSLLGPDDMATRVRHLLASHFDQVGMGKDAGAMPSLEKVAATLCVSPRTLIRQLARHNTGFRALLEAQQLETACKLLAQARYSVSEIGELLGYGDAANFGRAFRRLSGMAPGQYRRRGD